MYRKLVICFILSMSIHIVSLGTPEALNPALAVPKVQDQIVTTAGKYIGVPYKLGAKKGDTRVFDCSSFVQHVYNKHGYSIPRSAYAQSKVGVKVVRKNLKKGDLVFFKSSTSGKNIGHVGLYVGGGRIIHTYPARGVCYDSLSTKWLDKGYLAATRII